MSNEDPVVGGAGREYLSVPRLPYSVATAMSGFGTLLYKEILRFWRVAFQTIAAPVLTTLLYLLIFSHVMQGQARVYGAVPYSAFLVPGLVMMAVLQNAFANSSSSLIQSKITGNIIFMLLPPLSYWDFFAAYVLASVARGMAVGVGVLLVSLPFVELSFVHPLWIIAFAVAGSGILGTLGLIAGIWAERFEQVAAFQSFVIMPLTFLSGVFSSIHSLPEFWQRLSHFNPFFSMIDGFRYGFFGVSDINPALSLGIAVASLVALTAVTLALLKRGYKLRC